MPRWCVLFLVVLCLYVSVSPSTGDPVGTKCERVFGAPTCVCKTEAGVIDLTKIASFVGTPRFTGMMDANNYTYDYNPCAPITEGVPSVCDKVHACQTYNEGNYSGAYVIADYGTEEMWIDESGGPYVYYTGPSLRETFVSLKCDYSVQEPIATTKGDSEEIFIYKFTVISCHVCPGGCTGKR